MGGMCGEIWLTGFRYEFVGLRGRLKFTYRNMFSLDSEDIIADPPDLKR